jgi:hypothetical protein
VADEVHARVVELVGLARTTLQASIAAGDAHRAQQGSLDVPLTAFGTLPAAEEAHPNQQGAAADLTTTVGRLVAVYEIDTDRLDQTAVDYQTTDNDAARRIHRIGRHRDESR